MQGNQLRHGAATHCHTQALAGLHSAKDSTDVVPEFTRWHVVHVSIVAVLLRGPGVLRLTGRSTQLIIGPPIAS